MALRHLGRKMGVPALRPLARTPRRLASTTSQSSASHQGGQNNGARVAAEARVWKPRPYLSNADMDRRHAEFMAECDAYIKAIREERRTERFLIGSICTGVGMLLVSMWYRTYKEMQKAKYWRAKLLESL